MSIQQFFSQERAQLDRAERRRELEDTPLAKLLTDLIEEVERLRERVQALEARPVQPVIIERTTPVWPEPRPMWPRFPDPARWTPELPQTWCHTTTGALVKIGVSNTAETA